MNRPRAQTHDGPFVRGGLALFLLATHALLAYGSLPDGLKPWLYLLGIGAPLAWLIRIGLPTQRPGTDGPRLPTWFLVVLVLLAVFIRFYRVDSLSIWPLLDEGLSGFWSMEVAQGEKLRLFYGSAQIPPVYFWLQGLFFKVFTPSLASLWSFPALISLLYLPLAWAVFRSFGTASTGRLGMALFAISFWPFYLGRYSMPQGMLVAWELLALAFLSLCLRPSPKDRWNHLGLGLVLGAGCTIEFHWPLFAGFVWVVWMVVMARSGRWRALLPWFLLPQALILIPFGILWASGASGHYLSMLWAFSPGFDGKAQLAICWDYVREVFWGGETIRHAYKPFWGGFLNPLMDTAFCFGLAALVRTRDKGLSVGLLAGLVLFFLPGFLTRELEMFRLVLLVPFLMATVTVGLGSLLSIVPVRNRVHLLAAFLGLSTTLDFYHLLGPYARGNHPDLAHQVNYSKPLDREKAFRILSSLSRQNGPGWILTEFEPTPFNRSLVVATCPFNLALGSDPFPGRAPWAALVTNINYMPFLSRRFPMSRWFDLSESSPDPQENLALGVFQLDDPAQVAAIREWLRFERLLRPLGQETVNFPFGHSRQPLLDELASLRPQATDPFLVSCLAERIFAEALVCDDRALALGSLGNALTRGYPAAQIYNDLGIYWWNHGDREKARQAFASANRAPINRTPARENFIHTW